jgi:predicted Zn-dependent protease
MRWTAIGTLGLLVAFGGAGAARADEIKPPTNVNAEPSTPASVELDGRSAAADMAEKPKEAASLAEQAIRADPQDPWSYYDKGMALARMGDVTGGARMLFTAQQHFHPSDLWGRSVAVFGRAHILAEAGRCDEARAAYREYMALVRGDPDAVALARRFSRECQPYPPAGTQAPAAPSEK